MLALHRPKTYKTRVNER